MANAVPTRPGQVNQSGDALALFYKTWAGEVFTSFHDQNIMSGKQMERHITSGKSAGFNAVGKVGSGYHTPGAEIIGQNANFNEIIIDVDGLLYSDVFVASIDEAMNHFDVRAPLTEEMGAELAFQFDKNSLRSVILAARSGAIVADGNGGSTITDLNMGTDETVLADSLWAAAQTMDEKNVKGTRYCGLKPAQFYKLARNKDLLNTDWGGRGSYATAEIPVVADIQIVKCNHIPMEDDSANADLMAKYQANYSNVRGVVWTEKAAGVVKLLDLALQAQFDIRRQGTLIVATYAVGHGPLRPDCAIELTVS